MHFHCEIVLPPDTDVEAGVRAAMAPFDENLAYDDEERLGPAWWDWYRIGGRWSGDKLLRDLDQEKLKAFEQWLRDSKVTVSSVVAGKEKLMPESQIATVDAKWKEMFGGDQCPLFEHYESENGEDVTRLSDSLGITCARVLFMGPNSQGKLEPQFMLAEDAWNGVNHMPVEWDGTIGGALTQYQERLENFTEDYVRRVRPTDDWLCVTVDYHS